MRWIILLLPFVLSFSVARAAVAPCNKPLENFTTAEPDVVFLCTDINGAVTPRCSYNCAGPTVQTVCRVEIFGKLSDTHVWIIWDADGGNGKRMVLHNMYPVSINCQFTSPSWKLHKFTPR